MMKTVSDNVILFGKSAKSIIKMLLQTRHTSIVKAKDTSMPLIIMGNGPSLAETIKVHKDKLLSNPTLAVNFAANAPEFTEIKPSYYLLADPYFFSGSDAGNMKSLRSSLANVDWDMTLFVPVSCRKNLSKEIHGNSHITVETFNNVGIEGWRWLRNLSYRRGWGMPRPRNVLIPAIIIGIMLGYEEIYITGADHSWMSTISVNDRNEVISIQPHFYKEDNKEIERVNTEYLNYPLHDIIYSFYITFKSYHAINSYARQRGINIYNATPGSLIDAFPRKDIREIGK